MVAHFNGNPKTTITVCSSLTNVSDSSEIETAGDLNAHLGRLEGFLYSYHEQINQNGELLNDYLKENRQICLNTKFQKR